MKYNGITIHSNYSPEREASRFLDNINIPKGKYVFIISGAGAGFLYKEIVNRYPGSIILSIFYSKELICEHIDNSGSWIFGSTIPLKSFLNSKIPDFMIPVLRLIEWEPCARAFPQAHRYIATEILNFIEERNASIVTTVNFCRRWFKNSFLNSGAAFSYINPSSVIINKPVLITAAGPSLSRSFGLIKNHRSRIFLAALPSSLKALAHNSIQPDLIVNTDPGFWNRYHFDPEIIKNIPIAMPLTASFNKYNNPVLAISQNTVLENILLYSLNIPFIVIPENGTVAVTAIRLALKISRHPVFIAGLDLEYDDIKEHVIPHGFDDLLRAVENRFNPYISILYDRKNTYFFKGNNRAYRTYAIWLNNTVLGQRIYRINPSLVKLKTFIEITDLQAASIISGLSGITYELPEYTLADYDNLSSINKLIKNISSELGERLKESGDISSFSGLMNFLNVNSVSSSLLQMFSLGDIINIAKKLSKDGSITKKDIDAVISKFKNFTEEIQNR